MQNRTSSLKKRGFQNIFLFCFVVALFAALFYSFCNPAVAEAKSYSMPEVNITAEAKNDASLNVVEKRSFEFKGDFTAVWWEFTDLPENANLIVNSAFIQYGDSPAVELSKEAFILSWREKGGPGKDCYSVDAPLDMVYIFLNATDETVHVTLDYTIENGVTAYKDIGEVYWQYIGTEWAEDSKNVTMTLTLPSPENIDFNSSVRAWGHGPLSGWVDIGENGVITYTVDQVKAGSYAEARVVFPREWLTNLSSSSAASSSSNKMMLDSIIEEEQGWADADELYRNLAIWMTLGFGGISILLIIWAVWAYRKHGKEYKPDFLDEYWRDVPSKQDHPLVIARLWRWKRENSNDFTAELMYLTHIGAVQMQRGSYQENGKIVEDYYLVRVPSVAQNLKNPVDIATMKFLFEDIASGADSLWFNTIQEYGKKKPQEFIDEMKVWQGTLTAQVNQRDFFEIKGEKFQMYLIIVAILYLVLGGFACFFFTNFFPLIFIIPCIIVLFVLAGYMPRRNREANNIDARCRGLKKWLKDFSALDERPPLDVKVWGEFMVYAYIFGIAKEVMAELQNTIPTIFEQQEVGIQQTYIPWWVWYSAGTNAHGSVIAPAGDIFAQSVSHTVHTANAAISAVSGDSFGGGGSGFGGGFSSGGGGGFGGGGGAR